MSALGVQLNSANVGGFRDPKLGSYYLHFGLNQMHNKDILLDYNFLGVRHPVAESFSPGRSRFSLFSIWISYLHSLHFNVIISYIFNILIFIKNYLIVNYCSPSLVYFQLCKFSILGGLFLGYFFKSVIRFGLFSGKEVSMDNKVIYNMNSILYIRNFFRSNSVKGVNYINRMKKNKWF